MRSKMYRSTMILVAVSLFLVPLVGAAEVLNQPPEGFTALFNGNDLTGWKGLVKGPYDNPGKRAKLSPDELKKLQKQANEDMTAHWEVVDGILHFDGKGRSLCTAKDYGDFEMLVD